RKPSPKTTPAPPFVCVVPWKYKTAASGMSLPWSTTVSRKTLPVPLTLKRAPAADDATATPRPLAPEFAQGQAVPLPSPKQYACVPQPCHCTAYGAFEPATLVKNPPKYKSASASTPSSNTTIAFAPESGPAPKLDHVVPFHFAMWDA